MQQIISLGAYDRFNYGDLLFGHMIDSVSNNKVEHVSIAGAHLASIGGHETQSLKNTLRSSRPNIILGGGDVLTPGWFSVLWQLQPAMWDTPFRIANKMIPRSRLDDIGRLRYGVDWKMPFIPSSEYAENSRIVYHSVGGTGFSKLAEPYKSHALASLIASQFVSVRDHQTVTELESCGVRTYLAPDSVAAMALDVGHEPVERTGRIAIQASGHFVRHFGLELAKTLNRLITEGYELIFIPIGLTGGHSDLKAYGILNKLVPELSLQKVSHVDDIRRAIGASDAFIGTSLHGHITATALAIPNIALPSITKLTAYIETWSEGITPIADDLASIPELIEHVLAINGQELAKHAVSLGSKARNNSVVCLKHATG